MKQAIICDLDGTLSLLNGRDPYDASTCENDLPNEPIVEIIKTFHREGKIILLVSGRQDVWKAQTIKWLEGQKIDYHDLIMRKGGDNRRDAIIKEEIFLNLIKPHYNVSFVLDDRWQVVKKWRELGLTCLQVAEGNF